MRKAVVDNVPRRFHHVVSDLVVTIHGDSGHLFRSGQLLLVKNGLQLCDSRIVLMVKGFQVFSVENERRSIGTVAHVARLSNPKSIARALSFDRIDGGSSDAS